MNILVTGGAGYIGSHTCVELLNSGYGVVVIDNLCNSNPKSLDRVEILTGKEIKFYEGDVRDEALLRKIFAELRMCDVDECLGPLSRVLAPQVSNTVLSDDDRANPPRCRN